MKSSVPGHSLETTIWEFIAAEHFACFQRKLRSLGVLHQRYTLHGLAAVEPPITGFSIGTFHSHHAKPDGPQSEVSNGTFKKERSCSSQPSSHKRLQTVSVPSQSSHHDSLQDKKESPTASSCSHRFETEKLEECTVLRSGVEQQSFAHTVLPYCALPLPLSDVAQKTMNKPDDAHNARIDTLGWLMASHGDCGPALELPVSIV